MIIIQSWTINLFERHLVERYFILIESRAPFQFNFVEYYQSTRSISCFVQRLSLFDLDISTRLKKKQKKLYVATTFNLSRTVCNYGKNDNDCDGYMVMIIMILILIIILIIIITW